MSSPTLNVPVLFKGSGFQPGSVVAATDVGPTGTQPVEVRAPRQFLVDADGTFGTVDLTYSGREEIGLHTLTFTDGDCEATIEFTIDE